MKRLLLLITLSLTAFSALAGSGYNLEFTQGIMRFVAVDQAKAQDIATIRQAIADLCEPDAKCQVLFWEGATPRGLPMSREQERSRLAYWQANPRKGEERLYIDCGRFGDIKGADCL